MKIEFSKKAGVVKALELGGLGILAYPHAKRMLKGKSSTEDKGELAGLGALGAATLLHKGAMAKAAAKLKIASDLWNPSSGARSEEMHTRGSVIAKQKGIAPQPSSMSSTPLKSAADIKGKPFTGAPVTHVAPKPVMPAPTGFKPRMAGLGNVSSASKSTGLLGKAVKFFGHK